MKFGFFGAGVGAMVDPRAGEIASYAEEIGYDSLWTGEHMVLPESRPHYMNLPPDWAFGDPMISLAYLAAHTSTIRLCTGMVILPQRNPVHLAKEAATLDVLSGGRLSLGIGMGHLDSELRALGVPRQDRVERALEYLAAMRALWAQQPSFSGRYVEFQDVRALPVPVQPGGPPVIMGGHSRAAIARAAAHASGWYAWGLSPAQLGDAVSELHQSAESAGRDLSGFEVSVTPLARLDAAGVAAYRRAGADRLVITVEAADLSGVRRRLTLNGPAG